MAFLGLFSKFLSKEKVRLPPKILARLPVHAFGFSCCSCLILYTDFRERNMMEMYDRQIINNGESQASAIKVITYERSRHEVEKVSNAHPIRYD